MTPESVLKNKVLIELGKRGYIAFRMQVGLFYTKEGSRISTTLPRGTSDLLVFEKGTGRGIWIETKIKPRKPTPEQVQFIHTLRNQGCYASVCYKIEDLDFILKGGLIL